MLEQSVPIFKNLSSSLAMPHQAQGCVKALMFGCRAQQEEPLATLLCRFTAVLQEATHATSYDHAGSYLAECASIMFFPWRATPAADWVVGAGKLGSPRLANTS